MSSDLGMYWRPEIRDVLQALYDAAELVQPPEWRESKRQALIEVATAFGVKLDTRALYKRSERYGHDE